MSPSTFKNLFPSTCLDPRIFYLGTDLMNSWLSLFHMSISAACSRMSQRMGQAVCVRVVGAGEKCIQAKEEQVEVTEGSKREK